MNKSLFLSAVLLCFACNSIAADNKLQNMNNGWNCTTNASSGNTDAEKKADDMLKNFYGSSKEAFEKATINCRDCTKITCGYYEDKTQNQNTKNSENSENQ